jgi:hypothetical protein
MHPTTRAWAAACAAVIAATAECAAGGFCDGASATADCASLWRDPGTMVCAPFPTCP